MNNYQLLFSHWFTANYDNLRTQLCCDKKFGELYAPNCEDDFHNAYLCVIDSLKRFDGDTDFHTFFYAAYRRQRKAYKSYEMQEIRPNDLFWAFLVEDESDNNNEQKKALNERRIKAVKSYVACHFDNFQKQVFKLYFLHSCNYTQIAEYTGKSVPTITKCVKWCKDCLSCELWDVCLQRKDIYHF